MDIRAIQLLNYQNDMTKGWWTPKQPPFSDGKAAETDNLDILSGKLTGIHSEVSECYEDLRKDRMEMFFVDAPDEVDWSLVSPGMEIRKPCGLPSELADIVLRTMSLASALNIDLSQAIYTKMQFNAIRKSKGAGGKRC